MTTPLQPYSVEIRTTDGNLVAVLKNAFKINYIKQINAPHVLKFSLPATDPNLVDIILGNEYWLRDNKTGDVVRKFRLQGQRDIG
jgi:hypothetical protein